MRIDVSDLLPQTNVITFAEAKQRYDDKHCRHTQIIVDPIKAEVECAACGEKLNAIAVLARFAQEESRYARILESMRETKKALEEKQRTKCKHCGKITDVNIRR